MKIVFCADDYGMTENSSRRIEECAVNGILNRASVLVDGEFDDFKSRLDDIGCDVSLHINLVEGRPLTKNGTFRLLTDKDNMFRFSFIGLLFASLSSKKKLLAEEIYTEIRSQLSFYKKCMGTDEIVIDSHQHVIMIPLVLRSLLRALKDEGVTARYIRVPKEPLMPYVTSPSLYFTYSPVNMIKQLLLNFLCRINKRTFEKENIKPSLFMGVLFSGKMDEKRVGKILPKYIKLAEKKGQDIELAFHPGYFEEGEALNEDTRKGFVKFYRSPSRRVEFDALMKLKTNFYKKEGKINALH